MSIKKKFGYNLLLQISNLIFPLISFPYISRILGPEGLGAVNFAQSFAQYFVTLSALGIPIYGIREIAKVGDDKIQRSKLFSEIFSIHIISMCFALLIYFIAVLSIPRFSAYLSLHLWASGFIVFAVLPIEWLFSGVSDFEYITKRALFVRGLSLAGLFVFVKTQEDILPYMLISIAASSLNAFFNLYHARKYVVFYFKSLDLLAHLKPLLVIYGSALATSIYVQLDTVMLGFMAGDISVGLYYAAIRISKLPLTIVFALGAVLVPQISLFVNQKNWEKVYELANKSFSFICLVCTPIAIGMFFFSQDLVSVFSGNTFSESVLSLQIMSPLVLIIAFSHLFGIQLLMSMGRDKQYLYAVIFGTILNVCMSVWLMPIIKHDGASLSTFFTELLGCLFLIHYVFKYTSIRFEWVQLLRSIISSLSFPFIAYFYHREFMGNLWVLMISIFLCVLSYMLIQYVFFKNQILIASQKQVRVKFVKA